MEQAGSGIAFARFPAGGSGLRDLNDQRMGYVVRADPNTNLLVPRTVIPTLLGEHEPGDYLLACAVLADPNGDKWESAWNKPPELPVWFDPSKF
jgi:hypothetical protein